MNAIKEFKNPSAKYRGKPFWAWNGKLDVEEVRRQMRVFKQMGLGGGFMHSRVGLATPYLSQEWFDVINGCVAEAREQKMEAWLYDEDRWPSGAAGSRLPCCNPASVFRRMRGCLPRRSGAKTGAEPPGRARIFLAAHRRFALQCFF